MNGVYVNLVVEMKWTNRFEVFGSMKTYKSDIRTYHHQYIIYQRKKTRKTPYPTMSKSSKKSPQEYTKAELKKRLEANKKDNKKNKHIKMEVVECSDDSGSTCHSSASESDSSDSESDSFDDEDKKNKVDLSAPFNPTPARKSKKTSKRSSIKTGGADGIAKKERKPRETAESIKQARREAYRSQVEYLVKHQSRLYQTSLEFLKQHQSCSYDEVSNDVRLRLGRLYYSVFNQIQQECRLEDSPEGFVSEVHSLRQKVNTLMSRLEAELGLGDEKAILRQLLNDWENKFYEDMKNAQYTLSNKQYLTTHKILKSIHDRVINLDREQNKGQVCVVNVEVFRMMTERVREVYNRQEGVLIAEKTLALIQSLSEEVNRLSDKTHGAKVLVCNAKRVVEFESQVKQIVSGLDADVSCIDKLVSIQL